MPRINATSAKLNKPVGKGKKMTAAALIGAIALGTGTTAVFKDRIKSFQVNAGDGTEKTDSYEANYDATYFSDENVDVNLLVSNEGALTVGDMASKIEKLTGVKLDETFFDLYNMRYLSEDVNKLDIPEKKIWSTLVGYRADLYEVASYGMVEYHGLSTALRDNDAKAISKWDKKLKNDAFTPFNIITKESYAYKKFRDRYVSIVDKQAGYIKNHTLFDEANKAEVEANAKAFYELAQDIKKTPILEVDFARELKKNNVDISKIDGITASEGIVLSTFITANYLMFKDVYLKLDKEQSEVKYIKFFENEFQNYFDNFNEIMRKFYNLSEKECEEVNKKTKEYEQIINDVVSNNSKQPTGAGKINRTVRKTVSKSKKTGEVTSKTKVKPGVQVVDDKSGQKAKVTVDKNGNGSADVHKDGGETITHKEEVIRNPEKVTEEYKEPETVTVPDVLSEEEYNRIVNGNSLKNSNHTFTDEELEKSYQLTKH